MERPGYLYDLDDRPPLRYALIYGVQWAFVLFPALIITASLSVDSLGPGEADRVRFLQVTLLTSGLFTILQTLWGHRYPLLEGPSTALVLAFIFLAPSGLPAIQGGMIFGGGLLIVLVLSGQLTRLTRLFTPNVICVILMLIALGLLPPLMRFMTGSEELHPHGEGKVFLLSLLLALFTAGISHWLKGFWRSVSILIGMIVGSLAFLALGRLPYQALSSAAWVAFSGNRVFSEPAFHFPSAIAFTCAYLAVLVNSIGSLQGIAAITDPGRLARSTDRGILFTGMAGVACGLLGVVGTVSYSTGPGVILANRVASRYAVTYCGGILLLSAFLPKLSALFSVVPAPVVGAALCVGLGGQIGVAISTVSPQGLRSRDYFVIGLPVLIGTMVGFLPHELFASLPGSTGVFVGNSLIAGIALVLVLEHLLLRKRKENETGRKRQ